MTENRLLWVLQVALGVQFVAVGILHFIVPEGLPATLEWMYDLSDTLHAISGIAEILGGLGLILPAATKILPQLTVAAAAGLVLVMVGAVVYHIGRGEIFNVVGNLILAALLAYVAYGRWQREPIRTAHP
ncbi:MAG TPA: DoxX family protein [Nitriliruptorales bacterium]